MNTIYEIADYFLFKKNLTHKQLQKLCYYAQVLYAGKYNEKLIEDDFEAWVHGPVNRRLFFRYQGLYSINKKYDSNLNLNEKIKNILEATYRIYGNFDGDYLEWLTHQEEPWNNAKNNGGYNTVINFHDMIKDGRRIINNINK